MSLEERLAEHIRRREQGADGEHHFETRRALFALAFALLAELLREEALPVTLRRAVDAKPRHHEVVPKQERPLHEQQTLRA